MIRFRQKKDPQDLMKEAIKYLDKQGSSYTKIKESEANKVSKTNSKALVLRSFKETELGYYQIQIQDKELYRYNQKLLKEFLGMRITDIDRENRIVTAETDHLGVALDIIDFLSIKNNLSVVV
jgi:hypothetical protein